MVERKVVESVLIQLESLLEQANLTLEQLQANLTLEQLQQQQRFEVKLLQQL